LPQKIAEVAKMKKCLFLIFLRILRLFAARFE